MYRSFFLSFLDFLLKKFLIFPVLLLTRRVIGFPVWLGIGVSSRIATLPAELGGVLTTFPVVLSALFKAASPVAVSSVLVAVSASYGIMPGFLSPFSTLTGAFFASSRAVKIAFHCCRRFFHVRVPTEKFQSF